MPDDSSNVAWYERMSTTLLSEQPLFPPNVPYANDENWDALFNHVEVGLNSKRTWRWSWWSFWSVLAEYFLPRRYKWVVTPNRTSRGTDINGAIIDSTGLQAVRTCAAGMWTGLTSPTRNWFQLGAAIAMEKLAPDAQQWIEDTQRRIYEVLAGSNFYDIMAQAFQDVTVFGTAPVICYPDAEDIVRFYLPCAGEYFLASSARLTNNELDREFTLTTRQIVEQFGLENCPEEVQGMWRNGATGHDKEFVIGHCIQPNVAIASLTDPNKRMDVLSGAYAYREIYWVRGCKGTRPLSKKGFDMKPFMTARWSTVSNDSYGRSPCMDAIGDNKQVQQETRRKGEFIEKGVRPPMGANPELKNEPSSILPGNITYATTENGKKGFWPLFEPNPQWLTGLTADIAQVNARIEKCLYVDVFMAISRMEGVQPRNELELTKRDLERLQELGPFITLFEREFAHPVIQLVFNILREKRLLRPMPQSLARIPLRISYVSILRMAQKSAEAVSMKDYFQTMGGLSAAAKAAGVPDPIRVVDLDKSARHYAQVANFPSELLFTDDQVTEHDKIRQQEMEKAKAPQDAMAAVTAAKTLSDTQLPGGSALGALMGGQGGAPA